jgi:hypothetical protein
MTTLELNAFIKGDFCPQSGALFAIDQGRFLPAVGSVLRDRKECSLRRSPNHSSSSSMESLNHHLLLSVVC